MFVAMAVFFFGGEKNCENHWVCQEIQNSQYLIFVNLISDDPRLLAPSCRYVRYNNNHFILQCKYLWPAGRNPHLQN
jgi:hypothetical protein